MKICAIDANLHQYNVHLQPQCYVHAVCQWLIEAGEEAMIISDGYPSLPVQDNIRGVPVQRINSVRFLPVIGNQSLVNALSSYRPDIILLNVGLTSLLHLRFGNKILAPIIGILSSPIYSLREVIATGYSELARYFTSFLPHLVGALLPRPCPGWLFNTHSFERLIVMTHLAGSRLVRLGVPEQLIEVVPPGVDEVFHNTTEENLSRSQALRLKLGISQNDFMVLYAGSPQFYRGLSDLIKAIPLVTRQAPSLKLVVLSRLTGKKSVSAQRAAHKLCKSLKIDKQVSFITNLLSPEEIVQYMRVADTVVLPFRLVASGVPITLLEALALETPVIVTRVAGMEEFVSDEKGFVVPPHSPKALTDAIVASIARRDSKCKTHASTPAIRSWSQVSQEIYNVIHSVLERS